VLINLGVTDTLKVPRIDEEVVLLIRTLTINKANAAASFIQTHVPSYSPIHICHKKSGLS
jgi:hypothetical protein